MCLRTQRRFTRLVEQDLKGGAAVDTVTQHLGVDEEADNAFDLDPVTIGDRNAHAYVILPGITLQQGLETSQQRHEKRGALALGLALQSRNKRGRQYKRMARRAIAGGGWPGMIGRELQYRMIVSQLGAPVGQLPVFLARFQPVALPYGIVGILDRQRRQGKLLPLHARTVMGGKLVEDDAL